jgi:hypothetical protein
MSFDGKNQDYHNLPNFEDALREIYKKQLDKNKQGSQSSNANEDYQRRLPAEFMTQLKKEIASDAKNGKSKRQLLNIKSLIIEAIQSKIAEGQNVSPAMMQDMMQGLDYLAAVAESELFKDDFDLADAKWQDPESMKLLYELFGEISHMSEEGIEDLKAKVKNKNFQKLIQAILSNQLQISQNSNVAKMGGKVKPGSKFTRGVGEQDTNQKNGFSI